MDSQDRLASLHIRAVKRNASVKTTRAQQGGVKNIGPVGCRNDNDVGIRVESIHLNKHLVQGLLTFIMRATQPCPTLTTDRIDFIHKNDTGRMTLGLIEQVTYTAGAHTHEH